MKSPGQYRRYRSSISRTHGARGASLRRFLRRAGGLGRPRRCT
ncbi:hypothetical protein DB32_003622 [Sandaracinus amylolyticus]|uniref:Uncharacterized protein n=1 Tax=Sandaracinus amylolyticus TaxID=927083 RepID=A0A0F6W3I3_9BACT|nr:hypothetical protein DB32_003622 [Sandaracinus amylolyticus]